MRARTQVVQEIIGLDDLEVLRTVVKPFSTEQVWPGRL